MLACSFPFNYVHGFKSRLWTVSILVGAHTHLFLYSSGALGFPCPRRGPGPPGDCYRSIKDNEGNSGNAMRGTGRNGGQEQRSEGKASLPHHAETRAGQQKMTLGRLQPRHLIFSIRSKRFNFGMWLLKRLIAVRTACEYLLLNPAGFC